MVPVSFDVFYLFVLKNSLQHSQIGRQFLSDFQMLHVHKYSNQLPCEHMSQLRLLLSLCWCLRSILLLLWRLTACLILCQDLRGLIRETWLDHSTQWYHLHLFPQLYSLPLYPKFVPILWLFLDYPSQYHSNPIPINPQLFQHHQQTDSFQSAFRLYLKWSVVNRVLGVIALLWVLRLFQPLPKEEFPLVQSLLVPNPL